MHTHTHTDTHTHTQICTHTCMHTHTHTHTHTLTLTCPLVPSFSSLPPPSLSPSDTGYPGECAVAEETEQGPGKQETRVGRRCSLWQPKVSRHFTVRILSCVHTCMCVYMCKVSQRGGGGIHDRILAPLPPPPPPPPPQESWFTTLFSD